MMARPRFFGIMKQGDGTCESCGHYVKGIARIRSQEIKDFISVRGKLSGQ